MEESETRCDSTEKLRSAMDKLNEDDEKPVKSNWIVGSLDIEALYPSLNIEVCARITSEALLSSTLVFGNLQ